MWGGCGNYRGSTEADSILGRQRYYSIGKRKRRLYTVIQLSQYQKELDEGFTLETAARKVESKMKNINEVFLKLAERTNKSDDNI
jgi:hypothetical protein